MKNEECVQEASARPYLAVLAEARDDRHPGRGVGVTLPLLFVQVQQPGVCRVVLWCVALLAFSPWARQGREVGGVPFENVEGHGNGELVEIDRV